MPLIAQNVTDRVILGLMTFGMQPTYQRNQASTNVCLGPDESAGARMTSLDEFNKHLDHFQSKGYNEVDTARLYVGGAQEAWTRDAKWKDRGLTLATKVYPTEPGTHKPEKLKELFTTSLKELDTDAVDIFYLHAPDHSTPFEETLGAVNELHKQGKFVQLGLSNFAAWEVAEVYNICKERGWVKPTIYQAMYNAISEFFLQFLY
jgi:aflatoxin B1 aldehyde reductase